MTREPEWQLDTWTSYPGFIHLSPMWDAYDHRMALDSVCWCGAWEERIEDGVLVHHLNATERLSLNRLGAKRLSAKRGEKIWEAEKTMSSFVPS